MIEVISIDGVKVSMHGDYFETLIYCSNPEEVKRLLKASVECDDILIHNGETIFVEIKSQSFLESDILNDIWSMEGVSTIKQLNPVLPVMARKDLSVPFRSCGEMLEYNLGRNLSLWQLAVEYESIRGNISENEVLHKMNSIVQIMKEAVISGLNGTNYEDRILGSQSPGYMQKYQSGQLSGGDILNRTVMYVTAIMEVKSSMGVIVAAPTAGSCGALPGVLIAAADSLKFDEDILVKAMMSAGLIGVFIAARATFAAEVGGCMAETGSGGGMAAAALVEMQGGSLEQSIAAASLALQNSLGIICDPIGNRVEAPCLGRNVMAASNALTCSNMALANYEHLIPLDEVIDTMKAVGDQIHHTLRCTNLGGLCVTPAAKAIESKLSKMDKVVYKSC
jgi:L-serine dehydratase